MYFIEDKIKAIKNFNPEVKPIFDDGEEDTYRYNLWGLYNRVCEAIKTYYILYQADRSFDAFIIAGHALEICAMLSYIKDNNSNDKQNNYNSYFASIILSRIIANLNMSINLTDDISWNSYSHLLKMFYPIGKNILNRNKDYDDIIKRVNYRKGPNIEKIALFNKSFSVIKISEYIKLFSKKISIIDENKLLFLYDKYCSFKHGNMLSPGISFEDEYKYENVIKDYSLTLMYVLVHYLTSSNIEALNVKSCD